MTRTITQRDLSGAVEAIKAGEVFHNSSGSLSGAPGPHGGWGRLPKELRNLAWQGDYVICSYDTPIAWRIDGRWVMPVVKYSVTTTKHQGICRAILGDVGQVTNV